MSERAEEGLSALLHETRTFAPPEDLANSANAQPGIYAEADADSLAFWEDQARRLAVGAAARALQPRRRDGDSRLHVRWLRAAGPRGPA